MILGNGIQTMHGLECNNLTNLVTLELRGNCLETTDGIYLPNLRHLHLVWLVVTLFYKKLQVIYLQGSTTISYVILFYRLRTTSSDWRVWRG